MRCRLHHGIPVQRWADYILGLYRMSSPPVKTIDPDQSRNRNPVFKSLPSADRAGTKQEMRKISKFMLFKMSML